MVKMVSLMVCVFTTMKKNPTCTYTKTGKAGKQ